MAGCKQRARMRDPQIRDMRADALARALAEGAHGVAGADAAQTRQVRNAAIPMAVAQMLVDPPQLPWCKTAARPLHLIRKLFQMPGKLGRDEEAKALDHCGAGKARCLRFRRHAPQ